MKRNILIFSAILFSASIIFISCSKEDKTGGTSTLNVRLTDAPTAFEEVNVDIREVRVKFSDDSTTNGWVTLTTYPGIYNLLALQTGSLLQPVLEMYRFPIKYLPRFARPANYIFRGK